MSERLNLPAELPTVLSFKGPDALRFLNGQITQDVTNLENRALPACVTDAKGRLQYYIKVFVGNDPESLWISCPRDQSEGLRERLERYLIADDVEIEDISQQWVCIHSSQPDPTAEFIRSADGCFGEGFDGWWKSGNLPQLSFLEKGQAEHLRVVARVPNWGRELSAGMLPPEAGLDKTSISYRKGCYIGQEVLSRIKSAGKLNRRLAIFHISGSPDHEDLLKLDSNDVGQLTTCSESLALGYLKKRGFEGSEFMIVDNEGRSTGTAKFIDWV
jgi:folate-binding protein YgfZ